MENNTNFNLTPPFNIEMREVGIWFDIEHGIVSFERTLELASAYTNQFGTEDRIRIIDYNGKII